MFENYNHLGFINQFYSNEGEVTRIVDNPNELIQDHSLEFSLDVVSIIEILSRGFSFRDRTIIEGIHKTPWMAKPNTKKGGWDYYDLPQHKNLIIDEKSIAHKLFDLLKIELLKQIENLKSIGILLSGGMDSRISAGILHKALQEQSCNTKVLAITWGGNKSRDVQYARDIAKIYGWDWVHLPVTAEMLYENIFLAAKMFCEFAPFHLHAMKDVSEIKGLDILIASSFGDSIGRGVYSSRHLLNLTPYSHYIHNWYNMIEVKTFNKSKPECLRDLKYYDENFPRDKKWQSFEIERQANYMRRLLNPCMSLINKKIPVYQTFSSPDVFSYMWSLDPKLRNDNIYEILIDDFLQEIQHVPWSKTGIPFNKSNDNYEPDKYLKDYHHYPKWIRQDLNDQIRSLCLSNEISDTNIFNMKAIEKLINFNSKLNVNQMTQIDTFSTWLASLSVFLKKHSNVKSNVCSQEFRNPYISLFTYIGSTTAQIIRKKYLT